MVRQECTNHDNYEVKCFKEYLNCVLIKEINYDDKGDVINARSWYANSKLKSEYKYVDGRLAYEYQSFNGKKIRAYSRSWYENGKLETEINYFNGKRDGFKRSWHDNGQLAREVPYVDGVLKGIARSWNENGDLSAEIEF